MKLAVFGATGSVGTHVVTQALAAGHEVTAFVRDPSKLTTRDPGLRVVQGDVLTDQEAVAEAVTGQDTVLVALGAGMKGRVRSEGTHNIIRAMEDNGVTQLVCQSTLAAGESFGNLNFKWRLVFRLLLRRALLDHESQESHVRNSDLDWTIVRPASFTDGPPTGSYNHGFPPTERNLSLTISRADVAQFMLRQAIDRHYRRMCVSLSH